MALVHDRRETGLSALLTTGLTSRLIDADWPEPRIVRVVASVPVVARVEINVDGAATSTTRTLLAGLASSWPVPGGHCYADVTPVGIVPAGASAQGSISPGQGSTWAQGDYVVLPPLGVLSLALVPGLCQVIELQVTAGTVQVGAAGAFVLPPERIFLVPSLTVTVLAGAGGAELVRLFRCLG